MHASDDDDELFGSEEGEGMVGFNIDDASREALERDRTRSPGFDGERRLSRDLEEGFRDDSDEEDQEEARVVAQRGIGR
jgi:hypothetical protein